MLYNETNRTLVVLLWLVKDVIIMLDKMIFLEQISAFFDLRGKKSSGKLQNWRTMRTQQHFYFLLIFFLTSSFTSGKTTR